jgi:tRNA nucleotidyltransferase (CCA-adding enzyme)
MNNIPIKEDILISIGKLADENNLKIYVVGGYVRDYFLERERKDFDITVIGDSIDFATKVSQYFNSKIVIYERFRTAMVPIGDFVVEFVGTRKEEYNEKSRKPIVTEGTFEDDIKRRDFTVNTLACSLNQENFGELVDMFGGLIDLDKKILRTPLDPITTYSDDPLRMMRAARFAAQLNFEIEEESFNAISKMADRIKIISQERITDEFLKIISSDYPSRGLAILFNTGLLQYIFPELHQLEGSDVVVDNGKKFFHKNVFWHSLKVLDNIVDKTDNLWLRFSALMHDIGKARTKKYIKGIGWTFHGHEEVGARMQKKIFRNMKFPMDYLPYVEKLVRLHQRPMHLVDEDISDSAIRRLAALAGEELQDLFTLCRADITTKNQEKEKQFKNNYEHVFQKITEVQEKDQLREFQSPVRGEEIMEICQIPPSRLVGQIKTEIEEAILEGLIPNEYEAAKEYFLNNKDIWIEKYKK